MCWSDEEMRVRAVTPVQLQRIGVGPPGQRQRRVKDRILDDTPVAVLARNARLEEQRQQEEANKKAAGKAGAEPARGPRQAKEQPQMDEEVSQRLAEVTAKVDAIALGSEGDAAVRPSSTITSGVHTRTPSPAPTGMLSTTDAINLLREKGVPGAGAAMKELDGKASQRELMVSVPLAELVKMSYMEMHRNDEDAAPLEDLSMSPRVQSSDDGGEGERPEGMGVPFGLSV